jgi:hypothetical protein
MRHKSYLGIFLGIIFSAFGAIPSFAQGCGPQNPNCIVPTAAPGTSDNRAASTAFVQSATSYNVNVQSVAFAGGAKGDCTADDEPAIQAAINAAPSNSTVLFPPPTAQVSSNVTITIASPAVVTLTNFPYFGSQGITFSSTGNLPTGLVAGQTYYVEVVTANTFNVANFPNGPPINTTGTQSGTQSVAPLPCYRINSGLTLGNGSVSASSTIQNITLQATVGIGGNQVIDSAARNVRIMWGGASGAGTMLTTNGPISRRIVDLTFDGAFRANVGVLETEIYNSYDRMAIINTIVTGYRETALTSLPTGVFIGSCSNYHDQMQVFTQGSNNTTGVDLGFPSGSSAIPDVCGETWSHLASITNSDAGSSALILRGTDNAVFLHPVLECSTGVLCSFVKVIPPTSNVFLPTEIVFDGAVGIGVFNTPNNCSTWNPASNVNHVGLYFLAYMVAYAFPAVAPNDSCPGAVSGTFSDGRFVGMASPLQFAATADGATLTNSVAQTALKTYSGIPAGSLRVGDVIRVRSSGLYTASAAGTTPVQLTLLSVIGGGNASHFAQFTINGNETNQNWNFEYDSTIRTIGSSGTMVQGYCAFNLAVFNAQWCDNANAPPQTINTTTLTTVSVQGQWGAAAVTNSITLKSMTVEVFHPANGG